jgi:hypothetical protein
LTTVIELITEKVFNAEGSNVYGKKTPPRCGVTLDGVTRPAGILVPRVRQAPDGRK